MTSEKPAAAGGVTPRPAAEGGRTPNRRRRRRGWCFDVNDVNAVIDAVDVIDSGHC